MAEDEKPLGGDIPAGAIPLIPPAPGRSPGSPASPRQGGGRGRTRPMPTEGLPATEPITPAQLRANEAAKRVLRRLVSGEAPPTAPLSLVDRLAGSPYANPTIQVGGVDESARRTLDFALLLAETMFRYGAGAHEVETSIIAATAALGLNHVEVDITNQSVAINYAPREQTPISLLRVVRSWTNNYAGLVLVHQLVSDIVSGGVSRDDAGKRLQEILRKPKPFPRWAVTVASGVFAAAYVGVLGGGQLASGIAFLSSLLISAMSRLFRKWRVPDFFTTFTGSFLVTIIAMLMFWAHAPIAPAIVVVGGILLLLPTSRLVSATQDAINGFPVTAAGRYLSALLTFAALVAGIAVGLVASELLGVGSLDVTGTFPPAYPFLVEVALIGVAVATNTITEQSSRQLVLPTAAVGIAGYLAMYGVELLGIGDRLSPAVAAVVIGFAARILALRLGAPQLVVAVPAALILLPGLTIFRSLYTSTLDAGNFLTGAAGMLTATAIVLGAAAGIVLGDNLARPFTRNLPSLERRRRGRRR